MPDQDDDRLHESGTMPFTRLDQGWGIAVAHACLLLGARSPSAPVLDEPWLTSDLALCVRCRIGSEALALRVGRLDLDPTSGGAPRDSATIASNLIHTLHDAPDDRPWTDSHDYGWWGDPPAAGWESVEPGDRLLTLRNE